MNVVEDQIPKQPIAPYTRDPQSGESPEEDNITQGDEAQKHQEKAER